jgi:hypothetical protein
LFCPVRKGLDLPLNSRTRVIDCFEGREGVAPPDVHHQSAGGAMGF